MLHFLRFLFSRAFFWNLLLVLIAITALLLLTFYVLNWHTRQGNFIEVPNLNTMTITDVQELLQDQDLNYEVIDSARFNPGYAPFAVIEQTPLAGELVKKNRKIYLTISIFWLCLVN